MDEERRIVIIPRLPRDPQLDMLFRTPRGVAVQATDAEIQVLRGQGMAVLQIYATADEYVAAMRSLSKEEAIAAVETVQSQALAALDPSERNQFPVA